MEEDFERVGEEDVQSHKDATREGARSEGLCTSEPKPGPQVLAAFHFHDIKYTLRREKKKKLDWKTRKTEPRTRDFRIWRDA